MSQILNRFANLSPEQRKLLLKKMQERGLAPQQSDVPQTAPLVPIDRDGELLLSFAQQRLWFIDQLAPGSVAYNIFSAVRLTGRLDLAALERSLNEVVRRHEVLRTTFATVAGRPVQIITPALWLALPVRDLRGLPHGEREAQAHLLAAQEARWSFDLARGPLLRCSLLRLDAEAHMLLVNMHHIISDGWSTGVFIQEMATLYPAFSARQPSPLAPLPLQYADFAAWQRGWLQGELLEQQLSYWTRQLRDAPAVLNLPTDRPRPAVQTFHGASYALRLPAPLTEALRALARAQESTLFMTMLAAFDVLLQRYSGQTDILLGTPIANRRWVELEGLIGFFVNTLVVRSDLGGNPTFRELLGRVREVMLGAYAHQDLPFELLVEALQLPRDLSRNPLFQVMFVLQNAPLKRLKLPALTLAPLALDAGTAMFDLTLAMTEVDDFVYGEFQYSTDLFEASTIARMTGHFQTLLEGIIAQPDQRVAELPLLTDAEREQLLVAWNSTQATYAYERCLHELIEDQAADTPDAVAVVFDGPGVRGQGSGVRETNRQGDTETRGQGSDDGERQTQNSKLKTQNFSPNTQHPTPNTQQLTYDELDHRALRLARYLTSRGISPETRVAVALERSLDLVVALVAVLRAGGAYVPLDPSYPSERLAFMLEDSQAAVLITTTDHRPTTTDQRPPTNDDRPTTNDDRAMYGHDISCPNDDQRRPTTTEQPRPTTNDMGAQSQIPNPHSPIPVYLDADWPSIAAARSSNPACPATPDNLAYLIYTSGSTGTPKGAMNSHRAIVNRLLWMQDAYRLDASDCVLQKTPFSFDVSVWEFFWPLLTGARLVVAQPGGHQDSAYLARLIEEQVITTLHFVPSMLQVFVEEPALERCTSLRRVICSGEALPFALQQRFFARCEAELHNLYGPTEAAVDVSFWACVRDSVEAVVPIGRPIANIQLYILDGRLQPVPIGVPGELYIGGIGLARGYLNRPDLTAERFIPNPFAQVLGDGCWVLEDSAPVTQHPTPNTRLYRTGDLARYRPDGAIEYLGRSDQQVKVRGFRIELGEIETVLAQHPNIRECAVLAQADGSGDKRLVAYVVPIREQGTGDREQEGTGMDTVPLSPVTCHLSPGELRTFLKQKLPDYMVPSLVVELPALPLTPNGKVDRRALPAPDQDRSALETAFVAPRTPIEELLAAIWAEVLGLTQVGIHDNFFEVGGHSLLATQLITRIREALGVELSLRSVFETPTIAQLAAHVRAQQQSASGLLAPPLRRAPHSGPLPLSFAQQRLWFLDRLAPATTNYLIPLPLRLTGPLDLAALAQSFAVLIARHEALRTTFALVDGQAVQLIGPPAPPRLALLDLRALAPDQRAAATQHLATADAQQPFDLTRGPLLRLHLLRLDASEHVLLLTMHHIVSDGWSLDVLVRELTALYVGFVSGQAVRLPPLPVQYADYALWQRAWLQGEVLEAQLAYWKGQLAAAPTTLELPTDRVRPALQSFRGATCAVQLAPPLTAALHALSRQAEATLFMTLLAAFAVLLSRYSGQDDLLVGTPIANRTQAATEDLIGFFVNTLVLRTPLTDNPPFRTLLAQVREVCLDAYAHQELPFELLVEALKLPRDLSRHPLFQVMLVLQNAPLRALTLPDLTLAPLTVTTPTAKFDLALTLIEVSQGLQGAWEYNSDLFDAATIERIAGHFQMLLEGIVAAPELRLADLPLMSAAERDQLLAWNAPAAVYPPSQCLHDLVAAQIGRAPDAVALVFDRPPTTDHRPPTTRSPLHPFTPSPLHPIPQQLTYRELGRRAGQLAHHLRALGVGPETPVGVCLERTPELVIALLGVLLAGGAYLPLDPSYPADRLAFMLDDSQASVLVTQKSIYDVRFTMYDLEESGSAIVNRKSKIVNPVVVCLDADRALLAAQPTTWPDCGVLPDHPAYVIYTSGSTGTPKGVMVSHHNVVRLFAATQAWFHFDARDVWSLFHSYAFDFAVWELWGALGSGGRAILVAEDVRRDPAAFAALLEAKQVTVLNQVPSAFRQLIAAADHRAALALRLVIFGGEALDLVSLRPWVARHGDQHPQLVNMYGITETTVHVTFRPIQEADLDSGARSVIGRAIPDLQLLVLNPTSLQPVPIGAPGELYVGGAGLARGYLHRPDLTAERFIPNPFAGVTGDGCWVTEDPAPNTQHPTPNTRLYKTGDLTRYLPDGDLVYLGRIDAQVKVRGYRIELGEIAARLAEHPQVQECVVVIREEAPGDRFLVAYIVQGSGVRGQGSGRQGDKETRRQGDREQGASNPQSPIPNPQSLIPDLRAFLQGHLPDYMVPAVYVVLDALPRTPSGKLDMRALPAPEGLRPQLTEPFVPPRTPREQALAAIWAEVLGVAQVGIHDNFFALGGDSIRSIRVLALAHERGLSISLPQLFQRQTIAALAEDSAAVADAADVAVAPFSLISATDRQQLPADIEDAYPLAYLQAGMIFHSVYSPETAIYHNVSSFHLRAPFASAAFQAALRQLAARHPILRTSFDLDQFSEPLQLVHQQVTIPAPIDDLRALTPADQEAELARWFAAEQRRKFVWTEAPLLRFHLHRRSATTFQLGITEHHAILDGWSVASLLTELFQLYLAQLGADLPPLPPPPTLAFRDFVAAERHMIASEEARRYWMERLRNHTVLRLPRWPARAPATGPRTARGQEMPLADDVADGLKQVAQLAGVPLKSVLLAAHLRVLNRHSGQTDILTGLTTNGRPESRDGERVLGLFLNTVPFRLRLVGGSWVDLVRAAFAAEQELLQFRQYPLVEIQQALGGQPLFETSFNFVHFHVYQGMIGMQAVELLDSRVFQETNFTLMTDFSLDPATARILLTLEYDPAELCDEQIAALMTHYAYALAALARAPHQRYEQLALLTPQEQHQLLVAWNATAQVYPHDACIHELVALQAARTPDAVALVFDRPPTTDHRPPTTDHRSPLHPFTPSPLHPFTPQHLSYHELHHRAAQLAAYLQTLGVGPEVTVAIMMERSLDLLLGVLGVLKAGGVYVPLAPDLPSERVSYVLRDARVHVLLTQKSIYDLRFTIYDLPAELKTQNSKLKTPVVVCLDTDWELIAAGRSQAAAAPPSTVTAENAAYIIYTSGSTGQPKGVVIAHRALVNHNTALIRRFALTPHDRVLQFASFSFDVAAEEIFPTWLSGATLIAPLTPMAESFTGFLKMIAESSITVLNLPAPFWHEWVTALEQAQAVLPRSLRLVIVGSDRVSAEKLTAWRQGVGSAVQWLNAYGVSEATITTTLYAPVEAIPPTDVPIGQPIANTRIYVLDRALQPVPVGVAGELYLGGAGLARGYLNRPDLTAAAFIPNPFARVLGDGCWVTADASSNTQHPSPNTRLYRTGDLARYHPNGEIEFLGRTDHQVKLRGFRIEPGEIEALLHQHPAVREAVAVAREDVPGEKCLVAYVVPRIEDRGLKIEDSSSDAPDPLSSILYPLSSELRGFLQTRLPDYMLPSAFVVLDALPLTPSGKVDRRALPPPGSRMIERERPFIAPRDTLELQLVQIWEAILQVHPISITDDFFTLGGHSLLAVRVIDQIKRRIERPLALSALFQAPTIEQLAGLLRRQPGSQRRSALVPIQPNGSKQPFFCVHPVGGGIICYAELSRQLGAEQPFYGLEAIGLDENQPVQTRIEEMAATYIDALQAVRPSGPYFLGGWSFGGVVAFEMAQQLQQQGHEVALLALFDSWAPGTYMGSGEQSDATLLLQFIEDIGGISGKDMRTLSDRIVQDVSDDPLRYIAERAGDERLFPLGTDDAYVLRLFEVYKSNYRALSRYQAQPYAIPTFLFRACEEGAQNPHDSTLGWELFSADRVEVRTVPGDHYSMLTRPHVQLLAEQLEVCLESKQLHGSGHPGPQRGREPS